MRGDPDERRRGTGVRLSVWIVLSLVVAVLFFGVRRQQAAMRKPTANVPPAIAVVSTGVPPVVATPLPSAVAVAVPEPAPERAPTKKKHRKKKDTAHRALERLQRVQLARARD